MLEPEAVQAALLAAAGQVQTFMNQLGAASRSSGAAKLVFEADLRSALRQALQFGRAEIVSVEANLGPAALDLPTDLVVAGKTKVSQLAVEIQWHPRGEDHAGFAGAVILDVVRMIGARTARTVEQSAVLVAAPARFWRWLAGYVDDHAGYELLNPDPEAAVSSKSDFLAGRTWDFVFDAGVSREQPERLWTCLIGSAEVRSPWAEVDLHLLEVKGLGPPRPVR